MCIVAVISVARNIKLAAWMNISARVTKLTHWKELAWQRRMIKWATGIDTDWIIFTAFL